MGFIEDFFTILKTYNETIWIITIFTYILGLLAIYLSAKKIKHSGKIISSILGFLWLWSGIVFHIMFYGPTDVEFLGQTMSGVWYFSGILFIIQGVLFLVIGVIRDSLSFQIKKNPCSIIGSIFVIYSMVIYSAIGLITGYVYPEYPIFGTAPCPVSIFTVGLLLFSDKKIPIYISIIPLIWAIMGFMPVFELSVWADIGLILSGIIGFPLILLHNKNIGK
ncbi:MAG: DUF6064 family protein [Candidatus Bathyarchaeota archaeon]|jgi:hypothetical protein